MFHTFPKCINPKVNFIARLEFELAFFKATVQYFSHYATGTHFHELFDWLSIVDLFVIVVWLFCYSYLFKF